MVLLNHHDVCGQGGQHLSCRLDLGMVTAWAFCLYECSAVRPLYRACSAVLCECCGITTSQCVCRFVGSWGRDSTLTLAQSGIRTIFDPTRLDGGGPADPLVAGPRFLLNTVGTYGTSTIPYGDWTRPPVTSAAITISRSVRVLYRIFLSQPSPIRSRLLSYFILNFNYYAALLVLLCIFFLLPLNYRTALLVAPSWTMSWVGGG
ncbi:unnamed protein product [Tuber aestivum]|uniref:Uncharacterized protein n=1 Tax=Tuber aestivum TaxID=59557 RepID=A0A292Q2G3_9PEZI|nr:unnamed protein product [Tuber aestivum]